MTRYPTWLSLLRVVVAPADAENGAWKLCLKTLTRHGSDWTVVGETERGVPPIVMVLHCSSSSEGGGGTFLESTGAALVSQILSNSPACRVLAGLTKKIANKLGAPIDVMTDKWLPARHVKLELVPSERTSVRDFNPFFWCVESLHVCILWSMHLHPLCVYASCLHAVGVHSSMQSGGGKRVAGW